jgi:3-hydroxypropanoate dehydrogenase
MVTFQNSLSHQSLSQQSLEQLFLNGKTHSFWLDKPVPSELLTQIYDLAKMGPTSANCQPMRIVFVSTKEAKEKLKPCLFEGNVEKTMTAPVTAIFAYDMKFYEYLPDIFPHVDARPWFTQSDTDIFTHGFRNGTLQSAYFMLAARALGLDCGPMSGFMSDKVESLFFKNTSFKVNFMCNLGYGDLSKTHDRLPRHDFNTVCEII